MAIWHDAYLFDAGACVEALAPLVESLVKDADAYATVRHAALALFDRNPKVQRFVDRYGGWDRQSITTQIPAALADELEDVAFWLMFFVYETLAEHPEPLGLGLDFRALEVVLARSGWNKIEIDLLIRGRSFEHIFELVGARYHPKPAHRTASFLKHLHPASQSGWAGWVGVKDVVLLKSHLEGSSIDVEEEMHKSPEGVRAYESALYLLSTALSRGFGVCSIISG
jgi:hypothetical protein